VTLLTSLNGEKTSRGVRVPEKVIEDAIAELQVMEGDVRDLTQRLDNADDRAGRLEKKSDRRLLMFVAAWLLSALMLGFVLRENEQSRCENANEGRRAIRVTFDRIYDDYLISPRNQTPEAQQFILNRQEGTKAFLDKELPLRDCGDIPLFGFIP
jgi:hypothetical protein